MRGTCGCSIAGFSHAQTLSCDSPLDGRETGQIKMQQIVFRYYHAFYSGLSEKQLIENYAVTGGVLKYIL